MVLCLVTLTDLQTCRAGLSASTELLVSLWRQRQLDSCVVFRQLSYSTTESTRWYLPRLCYVVLETRRWYMLSFTNDTRVQESDRQIC